MLFEGRDGTAWANRGKHEVSARRFITEPFGESEDRLYISNDHVKNFIDCCFSRQATVAPIEAAHRSATISHLANIAIQNGRTLRWDPRSEQIVDDPASNNLLRRRYRGDWTLISAMMGG